MRAWLKNMRVDKGYTQQQVADKAGISRCFYTQLESMSKEKGLSPRTAMCIAKVLGFDWVRFYQEEQDHKYAKIANMRSRYRY